jgi:hypothetical protein
MKVNPMRIVAFDQVDLPVSLPFRKLVAKAPISRLPAPLRSWRERAERPYRRREVITHTISKLRRNGNRKMRWKPNLRWKSNLPLALAVSLAPDDRGSRKARFSHFAIRSELSGRGNQTVGVSAAARLGTAWRDNRYLPHDAK